MTQDPARVAVVTGANRGIGYAVCRQLADAGYTVVLAARDVDRGRAAAATLGEAVTPVTLDVTDEASREAFARWLEAGPGRVDVLVNNAGVHPDPGGYYGERHGASVFEAPVDYLRLAMATHVEGPMHLIQLLMPLMRAQNYGRIVNVASTLGQFDSLGGGWPGYRLSKIALNGLTALVAAELAEEGTDNILVNSVCPGWTRTDLGGPKAPRGPEEAADTIIWLATLPDDGPNGGFFQHRQRLPW